MRGCTSFHAPLHVLVVLPVVALAATPVVLQDVLHAPDRFHCSHRRGASSDCDRVSLATRVVVVVAAAVGMALTIAALVLLLTALVLLFLARVALGALVTALALLVFLIILFLRRRLLLLLLLRLLRGLGPSGRQLL
jgi:hypothetical protein